MPHHVGWLRPGAHIARKGGLAAAEVINTLPLAKLRDALSEKRRRHHLAA